MPSDYLLLATHLIMFNHSSSSVIDDNLYFVDLHHCTIWSIGAYTSKRSKPSWLAMMPFHEEFVIVLQKLN
jgi:hypothetical protein